MFLPRVKSERTLSDKLMPLAFPVKVYCNERPSLNLLTVLREMMPYGSFVQSAREEATLTIGLAPAIMNGHSEF